MKVEIENFFGDVDTITNLSKNLEFYTFNNHPDPESVGRYRGKRSDQLHKVNKEFFDSLQLIISIPGLTIITSKFCFGILFKLINF